MDASNPKDTSDLELVWSPIYQPQWDEQPEAYVEHGIVAWGRSRRLARAADTPQSFVAYIGIQQYDPNRWHVAGEPRTVFFLSLFVRGRTVALRTFPTCQNALAALYAFHTSLLAKIDE
jgi:hypothetical protein